MWRAWIAALVGCGTAPEAPEARAPAPDKTEVERIALMEQHYTLAMGAHDALVHGDLPLARTALERLSRATIPGGPPEGWAVHLDKLHAQASEASKAGDLDAAAAALGQLGPVCSECHRDLELDVARGAPDGALREPGGHTHAWAVERMWDGLTAPHPASWSFGCAELGRAPLLPADGEPPGPAAELAEDLHALARDAEGVGTQPERAAAYGRALATCAACHVALGAELPEAGSLGLRTLKR